MRVMLISDADAQELLDRMTHRAYGLMLENDFDEEERELLQMMSLSLRATVVRWLREQGAHLEQHGTPVTAEDVKRFVAKEEV